MPRVRPWGWIYAVCAGAVLAALAFVSRIAFKLECDAACAAENARLQDRVRSALWRLDFFLLPILRRENARPYFEYLAYHPQERSYTRFLSPIEKGEVLVPSPLLSFTPEHVRLHFQVDAAGVFTSPQSPEGNLRDLAESTCVAIDVIPRNLDLLARVTAQVDVAAVKAAVAKAEEAERALSGRWLAPHGLPSVIAPFTAPEAVQSRDPDEWAARQKNAYRAKLDATNDAQLAQGQNEQVQLEGVEAAAPEVVVGSLVPLWLEPAAATNRDRGEPDLFLFRRVAVGASEVLQGVALDWPGLEQALLAEVSSLVPGAHLEPLRELRLEWDPAHSDSLANVPARLVVPPAPVVAGFFGASGATPTRVTLAFAWSAVLAALAGGFVLLRSSLRLGERRSRFASAVTHELRTPLTTFRMYSEMLADDMVSEPAQRRVYLETLKEQSCRLATLVENVLAYARLEEGRGVSRRERTTAVQLLERQRPALERRAQDAGMQLQLDVASEIADVPLTTDADAVGQVLFNLVDNACKYARDAADRRIECAVKPGRGTIDLRVRDHGPGVPEDAARRIFRPFERGARNGDPTPGVGLGLALARGIASDLGGALELERAEGGGASFVLRLPLDR